MRNTTKVLVGAVIAFSAYQNANAVIDNDAPVVQLRSSCVSAGASIDNCFSKISTLTNWMATTRHPNASSPLKVAIAPGYYRLGPGLPGGSLVLNCDAASGYTGYTTFEGAGTANTVLDGGGNETVSVTSCTHLTFSGFTVKSSYQYPTWSGGGESRWINMEINTPGAVWQEPTCGTERGKHYWFSSRLVFGTTAADRGYHASCDESWFFGSEIRMTDENNFVVAGFALKATGPGEIHVYGGNIRALGVDTTTPIIQATNGGAVHIHGTGIDVVPISGVNATLFYADTDGMIHANASAYSFQPSGGSIITRVGSGHIHAPYLWEGHAEPPASIASVTGADMSVITNTNDGQPHLVIYSSACANKWFDTSTNSCH